VSTPEFELRPCRPGDIDAVLAFWVHPGAAPRPTDHRDALEERLKRDPELFLLAWDGDRLAGSLMGGWDGWRGSMYRLAVDPELRRSGIARRLVEAVEARLRELGAERVTSLVLAEEPGAVEFWSSAGYERDPATERFAKDLTGEEP
jgi:ribosomal protein S18 acetylase RimI-like enzyme